MEPNDENIEEIASPGRGNEGRFLLSVMILITRGLLVFNECDD